jgi:hypothetical protein
MPPLALASSNAMRIALALLTPWIAVTPDRSVMVPIRISVSVTPCTDPAAIAVAASATYDTVTISARRSRITGRRYGARGPRYSRRAILDAPRCVRIASGRRCVCFRPAAKAPEGGPRLARDALGSDGPANHVGRWPPLSRWWRRDAPQAWRPIQARIERGGEIPSKCCHLPGGSPLLQKCSANH